ncbi:hypothetical protein BAC7755_59190 [Bacillus sp. MN7755]
MGNAFTVPSNTPDNVLIQCCNIIAPGDKSLFTIDKICSLDIPDQSSVSTDHIINLYLVH